MITVNTLEEYHSEYKRSLENPELFWEGIAHSFKWKKKCNYCGNTDNNTYNDSRFSGSSTTMYYCTKCKKQSKVKVTTTSD